MAETAVRRANWNLCAILGFVSAFVLPLIGIALGVIALRQIKRSGQRGHDLALSGIVVGAVLLALSVWGLIADGPNGF